MKWSAYNHLHAELRRKRGSASQYVCWGLCGRQADEWANVHGTDKYIPLCFKCHRQYDQSRPDTCTNGHDVKKYGRNSSHGCQVCVRIGNATIKGYTVCGICGYGRGPNGKCEHK